MHKHHVDANFHQRYENSKGTIRFYQGKTFKMFFSWPSCVQKSLCYLSSLLRFTWETQPEGCFSFHSQVPRAVYSKQRLHRLWSWSLFLVGGGGKMWQFAYSNLYASSLYAPSSLTVYQFTSSLLFASWGLSGSTVITPVAYNIRAPTI